MLGFLFPRRKALLLSQEEALALLEMCAFTLAPERQAHAEVVSRVSELCREFHDCDVPHDADRQPDDGITHAVAGRHEVCLA